MELRRLLELLDSDGVTLLQTLGRYQAARLLSHHVDAYTKTTRGIRVEGSRHGVEVDLRYIDDGEHYVRETGGMGNRDLSDLSRKEKGDIAEQHVAPHLAKQKNYEVEYLGGTNDAGFDLVARDPDTGEYVIVEAKFISDGGSIGKWRLGDSNKGRQMTDEWIEATINTMKTSDVAEKRSLARRLEQAIEDGNVRKEINVVQNSRKTGSSARPSLTERELEIDSVTIVKIGKVID